MTMTHKTPYDVRVVEFHLRNGTITHDEYKKHLSDLADDSAESEETDTAFIPAYEKRNNPVVSEETEATDTHLA